LTSFQSFLFLLGSFFVPLFAVLFADWLIAGRSYEADDVFGAPAWRPGLTRPASASDVDRAISCCRKSDIAAVWRRNA